MTSKLPPALHRHRGLIILAALIAVLPLALRNDYHYDVVINAGLNAIVVVGLNLLIGYAGQISLGHAAFFGLGAYASAILTTTYGWPALGAMVAGIAVVGILAYVIARPILRLKGHYLAMATLGIGVIISIVLNTEAQVTGGPDGMSAAPFTVLGYTFASEQSWYWLVGGALLLTVWLSTNLIDSPIGRALRALHGAEIGARVVGIDTTRYKVLIFVISAMFASFAGSLFAHHTPTVTPSILGFIKSVEFVVMAVFGGMASVMGSVVGAVIMTLLPNALAAFEDFEPIILGGIMMGTMIFMPKGLVPTIAKLLRRKEAP
jgi:branched-chain amino acid transport system permease protein